MALSPEAAAYIRELARRLDGAAHSARGALVDDAAQFLGMSRQTVYRHLKAVAGWSSGRKCRADKGTTSVPLQALTQLGAVQRESVRDNDKQTMFTPVARSVLQGNGAQLGVSNSQLNRLMRERRLRAAVKRQAAPVQRLRALHPNHVHEVDPSLCLVYYLGNEQRIVRDSEFYKNKLENFAKVKFKVFRYVLWDMASGAICVQYREAAGEDQHNLFEFLMFAWGKQPGRVLHGVPKLLLWDKGSANQSEAIKGLLAQLEVRHETHRAGNARAKGGVENANNLVETQFESRLRFEPVANVAQLNEAAQVWCEAYNANRIPGQDTRLRREGLAQPMARYGLWMRIKPEQLRLLPPIEVCRALMAGRLEERQVKADLSIRFKHPQAGRTQTYSLRGFDGINEGDVVRVRPLVYGECAVQVELERYDGAPLIYRAEPQVEYDEWGAPMSAAVAGQEYLAQPATPAQRAARAMDAMAYSEHADAEQARQKKAVPFGGQLDAHSHLREVQMPTYLVRPGTEIKAPAHAQVVPIMVDSVTAMLRISRELGRNLSPDENRFLSGRLGDEGIAEGQLQVLIEQLKTPQPEPLRAAGGGGGGLRIVNGGN
ncbi:DDE-type integrase/transposase/recombinase [Vandammella animalimorsus]|uniref:Integrase n=1 Tax=Vandammella animalimorsus TaxID=2029117 RepID=A0A2A2A6M5_9BURK|nr:DDE-type integrase/transposase/recombinase [Vandammella animalimorsus]PAT32907.1 integrase [Vandammella animalimorsus]